MIPVLILITPALLPLVLSTSRPLMNFVPISVGLGAQQVRAVVASFCCCSEVLPYKAKAGKLKKSKARRRLGRRRESMLCSGRSGEEFSCELPPCFDKHETANGWQEQFVAFSTTHENPKGPKENPKGPKYSLFQNSTG